MALAGVDIKAVMAGLKAAYEDLNTDDLAKNDAYRYAVSRRILQNQGYNVEMFVTYEPQLRVLGEWWKQLMGESEGKDGKGILPDSATFSTDLHSLGQFIQQGKKVLFETVLTVEQPTLDEKVPNDAENGDGMNYLTGKSLDWINKQAFAGTLEAHEVSGGVPNLLISLPDMKEYSFGYLCYWFFLATAMTCYMLGINPFNQPGVEIYKKNMFHLLGKPGYEGKQN
jgi:glucose-6-phosphate isomerase